MTLSAETCVPCRGGVPPMAGEELQRTAAELGNDWMVAAEHHPEKEFSFPDFRQALDFTNRVGELAEVPEPTLIGALGRANGHHLHLLANGIDERPVVPDRGLKSVGHEQTFARDLQASDDLIREVVRMSDAVASRLRAARLAGRTVTLKVRFASFRTITRSQTVPDPIDTGPGDGRDRSARVLTMVASVGP